MLLLDAVFVFLLVTSVFFFFFFFFFQAEDGIRDYKVTGVQTCALPIFFVKNVVVVTLKGCHKQSLIDIVNTGLDSICGTHPSIFSLSHHEDHNLGVERRFTLPSFVDVVMTFDLKPRLSILLSLDEVSPALQQKT